MHLEIKSVGDDGTFEGVLSPYNNVDQGDDLVEPGAFTKSLQQNGGRVPMLWQHDQKCPIGELVLIDQPDGLHCKGTFCLEANPDGSPKVPEAQKAYALLKARVIKGLSIGYDAVKAQVVNGVRRLKEVNLWEGSVVTFPMNLQALVSSVKSLERKGDYADALADYQLTNQKYSMIDALSSALLPMIWSGGTRDDIVKASGAIIDEFKEVYLAFLPEYFDYMARIYGIDTKSWRQQIETKYGREFLQRPVSPLPELKSSSASGSGDCVGIIDSMRSLLKS